MSSIQNLRSSSDLPVEEKRDEIPKHTVEKIRHEWTGRRSVTVQEELMLT